MTGGEGHRIQNPNLNRTIVRMREAGYSIEVTDLVHAIVHGRDIPKRQQAMVDLLDLLGVLGPTMSEHRP